jgi:hypothetical protein
MIFEMGEKEADLILIATALAKSNHPNRRFDRDKRDPPLAPPIRRIPALAVEPMAVFEAGDRDDPHLHPLR